MTPTGILLLIVVLVLIAYDIAIALLRGTDATISATVWAWAKRYPILPFAVGIVAGHLFWQG